ncbi:MAG: hypothetical protein ACI9G1_003300 [Pirellulaceae bacterium]|jgi:hypothetical protein
MRTSIGSLLAIAVVLFSSVATYGESETLQRPLPQ